MRYVLAFLVVAFAATSACDASDGCNKGKRCGNSCIARTKTCHK